MYLGEQSFPEHKGCSAGGVACLGILPVAWKARLLDNGTRGLPGHHRLHLGTDPEAPVTSMGYMVSVGAVNLEQSAGLAQ